MLESRGGIILDKLLQECANQVEYPPSSGGEPDRYVGMFAVALATGLTDHPRGANAVVSSIINNQQRKPFPAHVAFNDMLRLVQMDRMREISYPYNTQEKWDEEVAGIFTDSTALERFTSFMEIWDVGSDVETRAAGPKLIAHTFMLERASDELNPIKILSVGSSRDHGLAMIAGNIPFAEVKIAEDRRSSPASRTFYETRVNQLLARQVELGHSTGVDFWPLNDPERSDFVEACRYYPGELRDISKRKRYLTLEDVRDSTPTLDHLDVDFGGEVELDETYDIALFSTSLYQSYPEKQRKMFNNAQSVINEAGKIIVQDFCTVKPVNPEYEHPLDQLNFLGPVTRPYTYRTLVYDLEQSNKGLQTVMAWNNGRCEVFKPGKLLLDKLLSVS